MGKFSDKVKEAAKVVASKLPTVVIDGDTYRVMPFAGEPVAIAEASDRARQLTGMEGTNYSNFATLSALIGLSLVDSDGNRVLEDQDDFAAFMRLIGNDSALRTEIDGKAGVTEWFEQQAARLKAAGQEPQQSSTEEQLAGNS